MTILNVYGSDTNNFGAAVLIGTPRSIRFVEDDLGDGVTRFYWITEENRWGVEGGKVPDLQHRRPNSDDSAHR